MNTQNFATEPSGGLPPLAKKQTLKVGNKEFGRTLTKSNKELINKVANVFDPEDQMNLTQLVNKEWEKTTFGFPIESSLRIKDPSTQGMRDPNLGGEDDMELEKINVPDKFKRTIKQLGKHHNLKPMKQLDALFTQFENSKQRIKNLSMFKYFVYMEKEDEEERKRVREEKQRFKEEVLMQHHLAEE